MTRTDTRSDEALVHALATKLVGAEVRLQRTASPLDNARADGIAETVAAVFFLPLTSNVLRDVVRKAIHAAGPRPAEGETPLARQWWFVGIWQEIERFLSGAEPVTADDLLFDLSLGQYAEVRRIVADNPMVAVDYVLGILPDADVAAVDRFIRRTRKEVTR